MHAVIDRQKNHGMHFRVLAKALRLSGGDHIHAGTVVGKLEGDRESTLGFVDLLRDDYVEKDRSRGIFFTQDWAFPISKPKNKSAWPWLRTSPSLSTMLFPKALMEEEVSSGSWSEL
jgi:hypothetical protein